MGTRSAALAVAAGVLFAGCSGDDGTDGEETSGRLGQGMELLARLGCDRGSFRGDPDGGWQQADVAECTGDDIAARFYASLTSPQRDAAVRLLTTDTAADGCVTYDQPLLVVAGDTWVAVVVGANEAERVAEQLDGAVQPGRLDAAQGSFVDPFACLPGG